MNRLWSMTILTSLLLIAAGCFPDYDRFRGVGPADSGSSNNDNNNNIPQPDVGGDVADVGEVDDVDSAEDAADAAPDVEADVVEDVTPDGDAEVVDEDADVAPDVVEGDTGEEPVAIGEACAADADCPSGQTCLTGFDGGFCSIPCADDGACPAGSACSAEVGLAFCLLTCEGTCPGDLTCAAGWRGGAETLCVSDDDQDGALNQEDNCHGLTDTEINTLGFRAFNPDQQDVDHDGRGDVCDVDPACPLEELRDTEAQFLDRAAPPSLLREGALVFVPPLRQLLYLGGVDATSAPSARVLGYDGAADTWGEPAPPLPYAARGVAAAWDRHRSELIVTPGEGAGVGRRLLILPVEGGWAGSVGPWRFGPSLDAPLYKAAIHAIFPDRFVIAGFTQPTMAEGAELVAYVYDRRQETVRRLPGAFPAQAAKDVVKPILTTHRNGRVYLFNPNLRTQFWFIDPATSTFSTANNDQGIPSLTPGLFNMATDPAELPLIGAATSLPFSYFARLDTGAMQRVDVLLRQARSSGLSIPVPGGQNPEELRFEGVFIEEALTVFALTTTTTGTPTITAREYFPMCKRMFTGDDVDDEDGDTLGALRDNCVGTAGQRNRDQADLDRDGIGDICDDDIDGDGIPNAADTIMVDGSPVDLSRDMDNDQTPDVLDLDDDDDGILDLEDPSLADSDNDGVPNALDGDDDEDGYTDVEERLAGSSPTSWISVPGEAPIAVVVAEGAQRHLAIVDPRALAAGGALTFIERPGATPRTPRLSADGQWLLYTDDAIPAAPQLVVQDLTAVDSVLPEPLAPTVEGFIAGEADFDAEAPLAVHVLRRVAEGWSIDTLIEDAGNPLAALEPVGLSPQPLSGLEASPVEALLLFVEAVQGCAICDDLYALDLDGAGPERILGSETGGAEQQPRLSRDGEELLFIAAPDGVQRAWTVGSGAPVLVSPEGWEVLALAAGPVNHRAFVVARPVGSGELPRLYALDLWSGRWRSLGDRVIEGVDSP